MKYVGQTGDGGWKDENGNYHNPICMRFSYNGGETTYSSNHYASADCPRMEVQMNDDGLVHREDGPAIIYPLYEKYFWLGQLIFQVKVK